MRVPVQLRWAGQFNRIGRDAGVEFPAVTMLQKDHLFLGFGVQWALVGLWQADTAGNGLRVE